MTGDRRATDPSGGICHLTVEDDGIGLPAALDIERSQSLGLQLVHTLTAPLEGRVELLPESGASFRITFSNE